jgi:hypothetical protein
VKDGLPAILELTGRLDRLMDGIENIKERQSLDKNPPIQYTIEREDKNESKHKLFN